MPLLVCVCVYLQYCNLLIVIKSEIDRSSSFNTVTSSNHAYWHCGLQYSSIFWLLTLRLAHIVLNFIMQLRSLALPFTVLEWSLPTVPRPSSKDHTAVSAETSSPKASPLDSSELNLSNEL